MKRDTISVRKQREQKYFFRKIRDIGDAIL